MTTSERDRTDEIAIVGLSCRLPGGIGDAASLWAALVEGRDLVGEVPAERFDRDAFFDADPQRPGKIFTRAGGFLDGIDAFDAAFFGVSPREAAQIDPQQRLLLELAVEAFDDAGVDTALLAGSDAAVFVGISAADFGNLQYANPATISAYSNLGNALSIAANRVSYVFDLHGPSMAIDTACSSGLVALHQACSSLRSGESSIAIAAGVNVLLSPYPFVGFAKAMMLSPHGRSAAFGAGADGYVRAEGGGLVVLKPLAAALADGDRVHAVIKATGVNSDGRTVGMSLPNVDAQVALLRAVYRDAGIRPEQLAYFEAHGTGTPTGDPIECRAIGEVLGRARPLECPLPIGSIKSNVGHLEPASGLAGLIKAILVLRHREIPPSLHASPPNPAIDFAALNLAPVGTRTALADGEPLVVGVNSFGFGGTNAHAVIAEAPAPEGCTGGVQAAQPYPLVVSARSEAALAAAVQRFAEAVENADGNDLYARCYTACVRRTRHGYGFAALGANGAELAAKLRAFAAGNVLAGSGSGTALRRGRIAFVFSGNGSQWAGMGADLLAHEPVFRAEVARVDALLAPRLGWSVLDELRALPEASRLHLTEVAQPALFALQLGIVALLAERGITPAAVAGHSVGEVAAAYACGAFDLDTAVHAIVERSRAQAATRGAGKMAAVALSYDDALAALRPYGDALEISAINSLQDVTVSGDAAALVLLGDELKQRGVRFHQLELDYAFHSRTMDPIETGLRSGLGRIETRRPQCTFVSTVTGAALGDGALDADYWWRNVRAPVQFAAAVDVLFAAGVDAFVEIGPHAVLEGYLRRQAMREHEVAVVATLKRNEPGPPALATAVARLLAAGATVGWERYFPRRGRVVDLPLYPWQRERHWNGDPSWWDRTGGSGAIEHPLLGRRLPSLEPTWHGTLEASRPAWLGDHKVGEAVVVPGTAYVEIALACGRRAFGAPVEVLALEFQKPLAIPENGSVAVQVSVSLEDGAFRVASRAGEGAEWQLHVAGRIQRTLAPPPAALALDAVRARLGARLAAAGHYREIGAIGLPYGPAFQVIDEIALGEGEALGRYRAPQERAEYEADPTILDGALQVMRPVIAAAGTGELFLPSAIGRVRWWRSPLPAGLIHVRLLRRSAREIVGDVTLLDETGAVAVAMEACRFRRLDVSSSALQRLGYAMRAAPMSWDGDGPPALAPSRFAAEIRAESEQLRALCRTARHYRDYQPRADALCAHFAAAALAEIGPASVAPRYERLLGALAAMVEEDGLQQGRPQELFASMVADFPEYVAELMLLSRCGGRLADVLLDRADPLELLFPDQGAAAAEHLYDSAPFARFANAVLAASVQRIVRELPADRALRVLEIGAGTGGTTAALLPHFPPERTRYTFTDLSDAFLLRAQERFAGYDFVEYRRFDVECDPREQGLDGTYDVVVAANVLHATRDLRATLRNARALLRPGGLLLGLEVHEQRSLTLVFGLLDGWWRFADAPLRTSSPLLSPARWPELLSEAGFDDVALLDDAERGAVPRQSLLVARRAGTADPAPSLPRAAGGELWIVAVERGADVELSAALARALREAGAVAVRAFAHDGAVPADDDAAELAFAQRDDWRALVEASADAPPAVRIALLLGGADDDPAVATLARAAAIRALADALAPLAAACELVLVARLSGSLPSPDRPLAPADAAAWGITRSLANETTRLGIRRLALAGSPDGAADVRRLAAELLARSDEDEVVLTAGGRFVPRVVAVSGVAAAVDAAIPCALELRDQGSAFKLVWAEREPPQPGAGQVAIAVAAVGLNYRDVMWASGRLGAEAVESGFCGPRLGIECAGVVTAVGSGVEHLVAGDRVYAFARASFSSHVVTDAGLAARMPEGMTFADAATLPCAFVTVHYTLGRLAHLQAGETILIHGAAGGVGLAALQYAQHVGARVIATAGSPDKRAFLTLLGVEHVLDSRSLDFAERVMELTAGRGVHVVLNSLAGEALRRNVDLLRPFGRMVELGKRDFYANARLGLRPFRNNLSFFGIDIDQLLMEEPVLSHALVVEMAERIANGTYRPLPHRTYPATRVGEAYRLLHRSRHVGKIVVTLDGALPVERRPRPLRLDPHGAYLVAGGSGGFGASAAAWLAERGARRLALVSRRGPGHPEAAETLAALARLGADATAHAADVGDEASMAALVLELERGGTPLRGVVHAAMVLDDATLADLTPERFRAALEPKMRGGVVLDRMSRGRALDLFVVFSSATTFFGNPGQANYVAGNLFLEALVRKRRSEGLPGIAVAWGAIDDVGYVARNAALAEAVRGLGVRGISPREAFEALDELLARDADVVAVGRFDWDRIAQVLPALGAPRFAALAETRGADAKPGERDVRAILDGMGSADALGLVEELVAELVAGIVRVPPEQLDRRRPLADLGMDSLMAIELRTAVESRFGFDVPIIELTSAGNVRDLAHPIAARLGLDATPPAAYEDLSRAAR